MLRNHVSIAIWGQNIACLVVMMIISLIIIARGLDPRKSKYRSIILPAALCLLLLTFANPGLDGVHRWISISILRLNMAMIALPIIFVELWNASKTKGLTFVCVIAFGIALLLLLQPDASQLTGFAVPMTIMLCRKTNRKVIRLLIISTFSLLVVLSWMYLDKLPPVNYVEEIVNLVADMGLFWLVLGIMSLAVLPMPFLLFPPENAKSISRYIGGYYVIIIVATQFGNFPVPLMGYGVSPILGYFISLIWYIQTKYEKM